MYYNISNFPTRIYPSNVRPLWLHIKRRRPTLTMRQSRVKNEFAIRMIWIAFTTNMYYIPRVELWVVLSGGGNILPYLVAVASGGGNWMKLPSHTRCPRAESRVPLLLAAVDKRLPIVAFPRRPLLYAWPGATFNSWRTCPPSVYL